MGSEDSTGAVAIVDPATDPRWDAYVERHPDGLVFHRSAWLRALGREYRSARQLGLAVADGHGELIGVLPLQWTRGSPVGPAGIVGRRLSSLPRTPCAGPLADNAQAASALVAHAASMAAGQGAQLQIKVAGPPAGPLPAGAVSHPWRETFVLDVPEREADLRFGASRNHSRIRWAVNKAQRSGVRVEAAASVADVRAWYPLYLEALRFNAVPPRPRRFFVALWEELAPSGAMTLWVARDRAGRMLAGSIILAQGRTAFYAFNGVSRSALALRPNDVIQWEAIHAAARAGRRRYDLGEVVEHHVGLAVFKRKWGGVPTRLHRVYAPPPAHPPDPGDGGSSRLRATAEVLYKRLPLRATAVAGDALYRYL